MIKATLTRRTYISALETVTFICNYILPQAATVLSFPTIYSMRLLTKRNLVRKRVLKISKLNSLSNKRSTDSFGYLHY